MGHGGQGAGGAGNAAGAPLLVPPNVLHFGQGPSFAASTGGFADGLRRFAAGPGRLADVAGGAYFTHVYAPDATGDFGT
jgi:hypothetical protein